MNKPKKLKTTKTKSSTHPDAAGAPRCGLCGKRTKLMRTECCGQWICDDELT